MVLLDFEAISKSIPSLFDALRQPMLPTLQKKTSATIIDQGRKIFRGTTQIMARPSLCELSAPLCNGSFRFFLKSEEKLQSDSFSVRPLALT